MSHYPNERLALEAEEDLEWNAVDTVKRVAQKLDEMTFAWCPVCGYFHCGERCKAAECFEESRSE